MFYHADGGIPASCNITASVPEVVKKYTLDSLSCVTCKNDKWSFNGTGTINMATLKSCISSGTNILSFNGFVMLMMATISMFFALC